MKRLLAHGVGSCFQICHVFREDPSSRFHEPEFTLLEWYRVDFDLSRLMNDVESLLNALGLRAGNFARITYRDAMREQLGVDPMTCSDDALRQALRDHDVSLGDAADVSGERDLLLDAAMGLVVGPRLGMSAPCFVYHYPASQAALSRLCPTDPGVCERFELFWKGVELANGYHELTDAQEQDRRFSADHAWRRSQGKPTPPVDHALVDALRQGMPDCAGVALGVDRLLMLLLDLPRVGAAMPFDAGRA